MRMKKIIFLLLIIILGILQVTIFNNLRIFNVKLDLLLMSVVMASLIFTARWALVFSVFAGFLKDVFAAGTFGINILLFPLWSLLLTKLTKEISIENNYLRVALTFMVTLMHNIISGLIFFYLGNFISLGICLRVVFVGATYSALAFLLLYRITDAIILSVENRDESNEEDKDC